MPNVTTVKILINEFPNEEKSLTIKRFLLTESLGVEQSRQIQLNPFTNTAPVGSPSNASVGRNLRIGGASGITIDILGNVGNTGNKKQAEVYTSDGSTPVIFDNNIELAEFLLKELGLWNEEFPINA